MYTVPAAFGREGEREQYGTEFGNKEGQAAKHTDILDRRWDELFSYTKISGIVSPIISISSLAWTPEINEIKRFLKHRRGKVGITREKYPK